jgi:hypothetical protein
VVNAGNGHQSAIKFPVSSESRADVIHKLKVALKELNEAAIWLRIVRGSSP